MKRKFFHVVIIIALIISSLLMPVLGAKASDTTLAATHAALENNTIFIPVVQTAPLPTIISPDTKVLPQDTTSHLISVSSDGTTYAFDRDTTDLDQLQSGSIMVSGPAINAPYGFLRKVTTVVKSGDQVTVQTIPSSLEEAIPQGSFSYDLTPTSNKLQSMKAFPGVESENNLSGHCLIGCYSFALNDVVLKDFDGDPNTLDRVLASGSIEIRPTFHLSWSTEWPRGLKDLTFSTSADQTTNLRIKTEFGVAGNIINLRLM